MGNTIFKSKIGMADNCSCFTLFYPSVFLIVIWVILRCLRMKLPRSQAPVPSDVPEPDEANPSSADTNKAVHQHGNGKGDITESDAKVEEEQNVQDLCVCLNHLPVDFAESKAKVEEAQDVQELCFCLHDLPEDWEQ